MNPQELIETLKGLLLPKRRIMTSAKLDEISAVDRPAMPDAKMVLRKRDDNEEQEPEIADESTPAGSDASHTPAGEEPMDNQPQNEVNPQIEELTKRAERAEKALSLEGEQRSIFLKMSAEEQDSFLALEDAGRAEHVAKAADAVAVVYTDHTGREFRKNDDPRLVEMAKALDAAHGEKLEAERVAKAQRTEKRAEGLKHLPGNSEEHKLLVEAVEKMEDSQQEKLLGLLSNLDASFAKAFETAGTSATPEVKSTSPEAALENLAKSLNEKEPKLTAAQAYSKALLTEEGKLLYAQLLGGSGN